MTPDGRYFVVLGRLWRMSDPGLSDDRRSALVADLMTARRDIARAKRSGDEAAVRQARDRVDRAKRALGERGPVWRHDGAADLNRRLIRGTGYADWFATLAGEPTVP